VLRGGPVWKVWGKRREARCTEMGRSEVQLRATLDALEKKKKKKKKKKGCVWRTSAMLWRTTLNMCVHWRTGGGPAAAPPKETHVFDTGPPQARPFACRSMPRNSVALVPQPSRCWTSGTYFWKTSSPKNDSQRPDRWCGRACDLG